MAVDSRISSKTYKTNVDELEPNDQNLKSELYEVSIFNHVIKIAPGLVIQEDNLSYCYVYAIKNNKVVKKIGVYELLDDKSQDVFDLSTFSEGSLCLFDVYERNPSLILELEEVKEESKDKDTVFDYLLTKINDDEPDKKIALTKNSYKGILLVLTQKKKVQEDENSRIITNLLNLIKKSIETKKYFNETTQEAIKKYAKDLNKKILSLIVSEPFLKVRFIFTKDDEAYDDSEFREWSIKTEITEYVIVSVDTFEVVETYPADRLDERYMNMVETVPQGTSLNTQKVEPPKPIVKMQTIAEDKSAFKGSSLNGPVESKTKKEPKDPFEVDLNAEEPKAETKAETKAKTKTKTKKETKDPFEVDLNAEEPKPKTKTKPSVKPEPKTKSAGEGFDLDLNAIDETEESETKEPVKTRKTRTPKKEETKTEETKTEETKTEETKTDGKKLKTPGASMRTKIKKGE